MNTAERAQTIIRILKDPKQTEGMSIKSIICEVILSAQFAAVQECIKEVYNTKATKKDTMMKYRNKIIKNISTVKSREV